MSFVTARSDVMTATQAALAAWVGPPAPLVLAYQNQTVFNIDSQVDPYLAVEIHFLGGEQISIGDIKVVTEFGQVHLIAHSKENSGTKVNQAILDHFRPYLELKSFSLIRTQVGRGSMAYVIGGWNCWPLIIPFWYHRLVD